MKTRFYTYMIPYYTDDDLRETLKPCSEIRMKWTYTSCEAAG